MIAIFIWKKMAGIAMAVLLCISSLGAKPVESLPVLGENTKKAAAAAENLARGENVFRQGREETPQEYRLETVECCKIETRQQRQLKRDKKILQRIVEAEAGDQDIRARRLVANVILNRVRSSKFPDTIREVVFAARQFSPVSDGRYYTVQVSEKTVEAVEQAQQKQEEAEKKVRTIQCQYNKLQENAETMKEKADQKIKSLKQEMKEKTSFWQMAYIIFLVFEMIKSTVVQNDLIACIKVPVRVWCRYVEWVIRPSELNIWGEKEYFSTEWSWCLRVMAIIIIVGAVIAGEMFVLKKIEQYRRVWDKYSIRFMVVSLEMIIVSSDVLRRCMPINLVVLFGIINIAVIEIRIYYRRANEIY